MKKTPSESTETPAVPPAASAESPPSDGASVAAETAKQTVTKPKEIGGREGPDPTRYGDWEKGGRCIDF